MALKDRRLAEVVVGVGRDAGRLETARALGAVDVYETDPAPGLKGADLVVLATPIGRILEDLRTLAPFLSPEALVTDVGSTKGEIARAGAGAVGPRFVGGHPLAGSERSGVEAASAELFIEAVWAVTPTPGTDPEALARVRALAQGVGARVLTLDPDAHDRAVAVTSHLPHVLAYALSAQAATAAADDPHLYDLAAGSFASATRVAASPPDLWRDVALTNRQALADALRAYRAELDTMLAALDAADSETLFDRFQAGNDAKRRSGT